jgi:hypothetical protein
MDDPRVSRRACTKTLLAGLAMATSALFGCRRDEEFSCTDTASLSEGECAARQALKYVDRATQRERRCEECVQFEPPSAKDARCGRCKIMKGPVHPAGSCLAWAAKS